MNSFLPRNGANAETSGPRRKHDGNRCNDTMKC